MIVMYIIYHDNCYSPTHHWGRSDNQVTPAACAEKRTGPAPVGVGFIAEEIDAIEARRPHSPHNSALPIRKTDEHPKRFEERHLGVRPGSPWHAWRDKEHRASERHVRESGGGGGGCGTAGPHSHGVATQRPKGGTPGVCGDPPGECAALADLTGPVGVDA
ncbi:hypothetical protein NDU88_003490 [Pleurodeles waltl]|uniref:Uncharacterized protein n=1 Tax=Pleurodeles waltl TaxID=8319 RepID=A0AAV7RGQ8_PLEWA|nr:hypothetical protein NDU88_003490 [Pleurodeles waltl]